MLPLANNFVAFRDFYTRQGKATFQVGTLSRFDCGNGILASQVKQGQARPGPAV
jgi:hypothetical protein